jgi:hypothetical protein
MTDWIEERRKEWNERFDQLAERLRLMQSVTMQSRVNGVARAITPVQAPSMCPLSLWKFAAACRQR